MPRVKNSDFDEMGAGGVQTAKLVLGVLEHLASRKVVGVTEIAQALGTTKTRVFRHLRTLVDQNYAVQEEGGDRYVAGPRLLTLARAASAAPDESLRQLARPVIHRLRDKLGHTVNLSVVYGDSVSIVETLPGNALVGVVMRTDVSLPLHCTAAGKLLLAERAKEGALPLNGNLERFTENTIIDPDALALELARIRQQGWASAPEEMVLGINALSAPIRDHHGQLAGMVSILASIQFITRQPSRELIEATTVR